MHRVEEAFKEIFDEAIRLGGTITGEHGIGVAKKSFLPQVRRRRPDARDARIAPGARPERHPESGEDVRLRFAAMNPFSYLRNLDYSVVQQCMHCGLCLPTCPTYDATKLERHSPRGRISLMRAIADDRLEADPDVRRGNVLLPRLPRVHDRLPGGRELRRTVRARPRRGRARRRARPPKRNLIRGFAVQWLFMDLRRLRLLGRADAASTKALAGRAGVRPQVRRAEAPAQTPPRTGSHDAGHPTPGSPPN